MNINIKIVREEKSLCVVFCSVVTLILYVVCGFTLCTDVCYVVGCTSCSRSCGHPAANILIPVNQAWRTSLCSPLYSLVPTLCCGLSPPLSSYKSFFFSIFFLLSLPLPVCHAPPSYIPPLLFSLSFTCGSIGVCRTTYSSQLQWIGCHGKSSPNNQQWHVNYGYYFMKTVPRKVSDCYFSVWRIKERKCQRWSSLDNIIHNRVLIAEVLESCKQQSPSLVQNEGCTKKLTALAAEGMTGKIWR